MTSIISMLLIVAIIVAVSLIGIILYHQFRQNKIERLQLAFRHVADGFGLSISTPEIMGNMAIGFDKVSNKLLYVDFTGHKSRKYLVDLKEVKDVSVVKTFAPISISKSDEIVQTVSLQFNYKNQGKILLLPFYVLMNDFQSDLKERTEKAKDWQIRLSRSLVTNGYGVYHFQA